MIFELKQIVNKAAQCRLSGEKCVVATVVDLDGSSYRKPGVRMLITESGAMVGAVSGGCVEREVIHQAAKVFATNQPLMMTYDGRYKLGCEGILYILIEPFEPDLNWLSTWNQLLEARLPITLSAHYSKTIGHHAAFGTTLIASGSHLPFRASFALNTTLLEFEQQLEPAMRLVIIGTEHDAVQMAQLGAISGFEVIVIGSVKDPRVKADFPGAEQVLSLEPEEILDFGFDQQTAAVLMTHSYSKDLHYALSLMHQPLCYFGIIGSTKRREKLFDDLLQYDSTIDLEALDKVHTPAGLHIGAVTPQEIAISVLAEIVALMRQPAYEKQQAQ